MTLLGKIFTVLILIMSISFMIVSVMVYATHKNWKIVATNPRTNPNEKFPLGLKYQIEDARARIKQANEELQNSQNELAKERAARRQVLAVLQTQLTQKSQQVLQKEQELSTEQAKGLAAVQELKSTQDTMVRLTDEVNALRTRVREAEVDRDTQFASVVKLTDDFHQLQGVHTRLTEKENQLVVQLSEFKRALNARGIKVTDPVDSIVPSNLKGEVTAVGSKDLIQISLGSDDGLRKGHQLDVSSGASYRGKIEILKTSPDSAVATIIKSSQRGPIVKGDKVGSSLLSVSTK